jgi:hydrogenase nickel incorporation protein HypB
MCATCGCSGTAVIQLVVSNAAAEQAAGAPEQHAADHASQTHASQTHAHDDHPHRHHEPAHHEHPHDEHPHDEHERDEHAHDEHERDLGNALESDDAGRTIELQQKVLAKNDSIAQRNRDWLRERGILAVNLMSSPGAGKTTLLERTARDMAGKITISVIEGDQETALDAQRILAAGCRVVQINTGAGCHLDAEMLAKGLRTLDPPSGSIVMIENVGNLVCPALFDLGEDAKVVLASVTEGADKPLKYPHMFRHADLVLLNKIDLLPYVDFDARRYAADLRRVTPQALMLQLSATTGDGIQGWYDWLRRRTPAPSE